MKMLHRSRGTVPRGTLPLFAHAMRHANVAAKPAHGRASPVSTGYPSVDRALQGGFEVGDATLLIAAEQTGATAFLLGSMLAAAKQGIRVAYLSERALEERLRGRLVILESRVNNYRFRAGFVSPQDKLALEAARKHIEWRMMSFSTKEHISMAQIESHIFDYHPQLVLADVVPRLAGTQLSRTRYEGLAAASARLAALAARRGIALVLRFALPSSKAAQSTLLADGFSSFARNFGTVLLLHRDSLEMPTSSDTEPGLGHLIVLRHHHTDAVYPRAAKLRFDHRFAGFCEL